MKRQHKLILGTALLVVPTVIYATVTRVDDLDVRHTNKTVNTISNGSAAIGYNSHSNSWSLTVGSHNKALDNSFSSGTNEVRNFGGAIGHSNNVNYDATGQYPRHSFAAGLSNTVLGNSSFASGSYGDINADNATALGKGITIAHHKAVVVGEYNEDKADVRFAVGNGDDSSNRSNALEVYKNGDVIINKAQGDIGMGGFGN